MDKMVKESKELLEDLDQQADGDDESKDNFEDYLPDGAHGPFSLDETSKPYMMPGKNSKKDKN